MIQCILYNITVQLNRMYLNMYIQFMSEHSSNYCSNTPHKELTSIRRHITLNKFCYFHLAQYIILILSYVYDTLCPLAYRTTVSAAYSGFSLTAEKTQDPIFYITDRSSLNFSAYNGAIAAYNGYFGQN